MSQIRKGAPVHGNYHGYYSKRPFVRDPRLALLPPTLFEGARVLDVGCNEGWVTCEIAQAWGAHWVLGVDLDEDLIRAAWRRRRTVWSLQAPHHRPPSPADTDAPSTSKRRKRDDAHPRAGRPDHFPASCEHTHGPLPIPPAQHRGKHAFPHNVLFRTADWPAARIPEDAGCYDVVVAFSVSKWIHLNGGDAALTAFFRRVHSVLSRGGAFVLEPQAWETYAKAKRMDEKLRENAKALNIRPDDFEALLGEIGFGPAQHLGTSGEGGFRRPVDLYIKL